MSRRLISLVSVPWLMYGIGHYGWRWFVAHHVRREVEWFRAGGAEPRFLLHCPGFPRTGPGAARLMPFDQFLQTDASRPDWRWPLKLSELRREFAAAWRPVTRGEGIDVGCYLGGLRWHGDPSVNTDHPDRMTPFDDPDFGEALRRGDAGYVANRVEESLRPPIDAGMRLVLDTAGQVKESHPLHRLVRYLESLGVSCAVEPPPPIHAGDPYRHWYAQDKLIVAESLNPAHLPLYAARFAGRTTCLLNAYARDRASEVRRIRDVLAYGPQYDAAFRVFGFNATPGAADLGVTAAELLAA